MNHQPLRLSVLDQSPVRQGGTARQAILETVELAQLADRLGYTRYWVSEHHNTATLAGSTPEVLLAHLGGVTRRIRLGSGGVMLPHYSALKVAENFRMLETLFPGRIDLGVGRAPGSDRLTASVLNPANNFAENDFIEQLMDLSRYLTDADEPGSIQEKVKASPRAETVPEPWILSSSGQSGLFAAYLGMAFSFAHFINPTGGPQMVKMYQDRFKPSVHLQQPLANVAVFVLCADTEEKARQLHESLALQMLRLERGERQPMGPYEEIKDYQYSAAELERMAYHRQRIISGTPARLKDQLTDLARQYGVGEVVAVTITYDFADRLRSYQLLAEAFALTPAEFVAASV
ncbi:LLM class flavin-dependent oxidoreductase [Hymenobacter chitinivorans]|uniref:Luciferase-like monooxygenase n=1 Tax=Hymenobacter chitinivorans DSM 11115 TaxID=1121954 RepID=A0A2M9BSD9_9BACT|nr:LLM class flavin-dependent oxidoreductase [Hymenobacter chitinivorans]PJJ60847.1 luciferase family oxidoreductase group 1 [Hymenobacter chitinivorans DSM 11115]